MPPLAGPWRAEAAAAYLGSLQARGLSLEAVEGRLRIPPGHCPAEVELVRLLKPELVAIMEQDARDLAEERAGILEYQAGFTRADAERRARVPGQNRAVCPIESPETTVTKRSA